MKIVWIASAGLLAGCSPSSTDEPAAKPVALVTIAPATASSVAETLTIYGVADSGSAGQRALPAPVEAIVSTIVAPVGTHVERGQVVAQLRPSPTARLDLVRATTDANAADTAFARAKRLRADGLVGNAEVETARAAAAAADATRASLSGRSGALTLVAPIAGTVSAVPSSPGDLVAPGTTVATIIIGGNSRARFGVDPQVANRIRPGAPVIIRRAAGGPEFTTSVASIDRAVDPQTRLSSLYATIPRGAEIGNGEPLRADLTIGGGGAAVSVPYAALLDDGGQPYVFVVERGVANRRDVAIGPTMAGRVVVSKGVKLGDRVVLQGGTAVEDGMKVRTR